MKIEKESKKIFKVIFEPSGWLSLQDYVIARTLKKAKELAIKMYATRKVLKVVRIYDKYQIYDK
jgi:hypothetical protein